MKNKKKYRLILLVTLTFASMITPHATAITPTYDPSSVGVTAGTVLLYTIYSQGSTFGKYNGFKLNLTITSVGLNTQKYVNNNIVEINGTCGQYNISAQYWEEMISEGPLYDWNGTLYNYSMYGLNALFIIPKPINLTWLNISLTNKYSTSFTIISELTTNATMVGMALAGTHLITTYSVLGVATKASLYNSSTNHLILQYTLDIPDSGGGSIPYSNFFLGISAVAIIGVVVLLVRRRKVLLIR